jgi:nucleotide-binding universal stress UspA family protein
MMISFEKILIPVDFSEPSKNALKYGLTLASQFNAKVIVAHIVPESSALQYAFPTETSRVERHQEDEALHAVQELLASSHVPSIDVRTVVKTGIIGIELLQLVKDEDVRLVVMGTHGRRKLGRWFIGSIAEGLLRQVPVPILTVSHVGADAPPLGLISLKRILYATDLAESTNAGLKTAVALARGIGAQLTVMHSVHYPDRILWAPKSATFDDERLEALNEMSKRIGEVSEEVRGPRIPIDTVVVAGKPFEKILEVATERSADIIVINLQSKGTFERAFLGATAERVVRLAPVPVLSIPTP